MAKARGILFHHFWGTYSAGIQLLFCEDVDHPFPTKQCADESIGGTPHSVDCGPPFEIEIDAQAHKQTAFSF